MELEEALLEGWMRHYYFDVEHDIGSSGVADYSLAEIRHLLGISTEDLDRIVLQDSRTLGGNSIRKTLTNKYLDGDPDKVIVTHGSTEANFLIMSTLVGPGDEIIALDPSYQQLYAVAAARGAGVRRWPLRFENSFRPDFTELRPLINTQTRMIVVNFPHNPTGATLTAEEQSELLEIAAEANIYVIWDGAFTLLTYESEPLPEPLLEYSKAISMSTLSKAYGLPGLRVGWCFAQPEVLERFIQWRDYTLLHLSPLIEYLAEQAIRYDQALIKPRLDTARANRTKLAAWVAEHSDLAEWVEPKGGVCAFLRFPKVKDTEKLCHRLAREHKVLLVPGMAFGMPQHVRFGFGGSGTALEHGLGALSKLLPQEMVL